MRSPMESPERLRRALIRLAKAVGVATSYVGQSNDYHEIGDQTLIKVLAALGIRVGDEADAARVLTTLTDSRHARLVEPTVLHVSGSESRVRVNAGILDVPEASITLENGSAYEGAITLDAGDGPNAYLLGDRFVATSYLVIPADVPVGYHTLHVRAGAHSMDATLICAPQRIDLIDALRGQPWQSRSRHAKAASLRPPQLWGWMAQLYSIRSHASWGVGDFADLASMLEQAKAKTGADFMLINPVHAGEPALPLTPSPYLPISRRLINFTYIRPEAVEEYQLLGQESRERIRQLQESVASLNADPDRIDRDVMWKAKARALWIIFKAGRTRSRQWQFDEFVRQAGEDLEAYATWCLAYDKWGVPGTEPDSWIHTMDRRSSQVRHLREEFPESFDFYRWLEWIATEQLDAAQRTAVRSGMHIGIMADMAVGVHPQGSDVWWHPERYARGATVGAPPDYFNQQGQDWSQPPLNPLDLQRTGYAAYRSMVHEMFAHAGAVRIDHILGLFRLWWIPTGNTPRDGAYVAYDSAVMLGILAIEASRVHGVVVGEDLGVVPDYVAEALRSHGVFGCVVEWFEQRDGVFRKPDAWREYALASVNTHDMPPAAGYLRYEHVQLRERLHLLTGSAEEFQRSAEHEHQAMMRMLVEGGWAQPQWLEHESEHTQDIVEALYRALRSAPSRLLAASLADAVGEHRTQNQPGTNNEYPNWRIPLADDQGRIVPVETLFDNPRLQSLSRIMNTER